MVVLSKLLNASLRDATCQDVFHPGRTCLQYQMQTYPKFLIAPMKYFLPLIGVSLALKGRSLRRKHVAEAFRYYVELCATAYLLGQSVTLALCIERRLLRGCNRLTFINLPVLIGTWSLLFTSTKVIRLFSLSITQVISLALKGRKLRKKDIRDALMHYVEMCITGYLLGQSVTLALCLERRLKGNRLTFINLSTLIGTWPFLIVSNKVLRLITLSITQVSFFALLRRSTNPILRIMRESKLSLTILFMMCSSFILHSLQRYKSKVFWVIKPLPSSEGHPDAKCTHSDSCLKSCFLELVKVALISIPLDLFKTFSNHIKKPKSISATIKKLFLKMDFQTTIFMTSYISIYRLSSCFLTRSGTLDPQLRHIMAAFLGGFGFYFVPKLPLFCYGVSVCCELVWDLIKRDKSGKWNGLIDTFEKYRILRFYTMLSAVYMVNTYVFHAQYINAMGMTMISTMTGYQGPELKKGIQNYIRSIS